MLINLYYGVTYKPQLYRAQILIIPITMLVKEVFDLGQYTLNTFIIPTTMLN